MNRNERSRDNRKRINCILHYNVFRGYRAKHCYGGRNKTNTADKIRLNQRWIRETEEKINQLNAEIAVYLIERNGYRRAISDLAGEEE
jgi:hypothetical protein